MTKKNKNSWPTLGWMREQGKRLILFKSDPNPSTCVFASEWKYHAENKYSVTNKESCAFERSESVRKISDRKNIPLILVFNYFSSFNALDYNATKLGYKDSLKDVLDYAKVNGFGREEQRYKGINPTTLAVDFAEWGDALDFVRTWNTAKCK